MNFIIVIDTFYPNKTSASNQIKDLSNQFSVYGHNITLIVPSSEIKENFKLVSFKKHKNFKN